MHETLDGSQACGHPFRLRAKAMLLAIALASPASAFFGTTDAMAQQAQAQPGSAVQMAAQTGQAAPPRCDANCVRANAPKAAEACAPRIEAQAPSDFDWLTRPNPGIFQQADPSSPADSIVHYRGDSIRFMTGDKSWLRVSYECGYDVGSQSVAYVHVRAGRLGQPLPIAVQQDTASPRQAVAAQPRRIAAPVLGRPGPAPHRAKPHVGEPSPIEIEQEAANPKQR